MSCAPRPVCCVVFTLAFYREKYYIGLINDPELHVKLTGSWETTVGHELDTFRTCPKTFAIIALARRSPGYMLTL